VRNSINQGQFANLRIQKEMNDNLEVVVFEGEIKGTVEVELIPTCFRMVEVQPAVVDDTSPGRPNLGMRKTHSMRTVLRGNINQSKNDTEFPTARLENC
jgi:GDP-D-mannose dehydratase